jgi:hypothetical protein
MRVGRGWGRGRSGQGEKNEEASRSVGVNALGGGGGLRCGGMREGGGAARWGRSGQPLKHALKFEGAFEPLQTKSSKQNQNRTGSFFVFIPVLNRENRILQPNEDNCRSVPFVLVRC